MFGKLTLEAIPYHEPIIMVTIAGIILGGLAIAGLITYYGKWQYLWKEWLTSVDHKKIGIMYGIGSMFFFIVGGSEALLIRAQLARPGQKLLSAALYNQVFTMHGVTMVFLVVMPMAAPGSYVRTG